MALVSIRWGLKSEMESNKNKLFNMTVVEVEDDKVDEFVRLANGVYERPGVGDMMVIAVEIK